MPLMATTAPAVSARWVAASAVSEPFTRPADDQNHSDGPQSEHAIGWAWNRRFAGSWYSAAHRSHMANADMVVAGRSYGNSRMMVKRGPQLVQVTNGCRKRLSCESNSSATQSWHTAMSGGIGVLGVPAPVAVWLATIRNPHRVSALVAAV